MNAVPVVLLVLLAGISLSQQASFNTPRALKMIMRDRNANKTKITKTELSIFEKDPRSKPRLDFTPRGKKPQNVNAGQAAKLVQSQIIGGAKATQEMIPWQVYLHIDDTWLCGGSIISPIWVLTAAHCVYKSKRIVVTAGGVNRLSNEAGEVMQTSITTIVHEFYNSIDLANDVALIKIPKAYTFNSYINAVKLPKISDAKKSFANIKVTASGYGKTPSGLANTDLNYVTLNTVTNVKCASVYGFYYIRSSVICTSTSSSKTICGGDSGGSLTYKGTDGKETIIGVVSFGSAKSCQNSPTGYSRVSSFLGWISGKTGIKVDP